MSTPPSKMGMLQLHASAKFMDKLTLIALVVALVALTSAGVTTWLSFRYHQAMGTREATIVARYKAQVADEAGQLEKEVASARERQAQLEKTLAEAGKKAAAADTRAGELEKKAESATARVADLEKELAEARARVEETAAADKPAALAEQPTAAADEQEAKNRQLVEALHKFAGTKAAIYAVDEAPDSPDAATTVDDLLVQAGWAASVWKWAGVSGMVGVAIVTKEGDDATIEAAASALTDALSAAGFHAAKASWPKDTDWRRVRGTFTGPQSPEPTEAPIRIVIGSKSRS